MFQGVIGIVVFLLIAWAVSENRKKVDVRTILAGLGLQFAIGLLLLKVPGVQQVFLWLNDVVLLIDKATTAGTTFVFGYLGGGPLPFAELENASSFVLAFKAMPILLVMSALSALLFYWRVLPVIVKGFSMLLRKTMGMSGPLGLSTAVNVFVGMVEAPLFIRPYLARMTRSELFALMTAGMATVAGTVLVLYAFFLKDVLPGALGHILTASLMSAPAAILIARMMVPEEDAEAVLKEGELTPPQTASSSMDAITKGTTEGIKLLIPILALLVVLVALVALVNAILGQLPLETDVTLEGLLGYAMAPVAWLMGVPWAEAVDAGQLMGVKVVLNELLAYLNLAHLPEGTLSPRSVVIMTYAMCGFANFGSLGIMIGGLGGMVPERREEIVALGMRSILSGVLATCMTGAIVGLLV